MSSNKVLIHIGKCGGKTLHNKIKALGIGLVHVAKPTYKPDTTYYILLRDPIDRIVSAFNYMYTLIPDMKPERKKRFKEDHRVLLKYDSINNLAEQLYDDKGNLVKEVSKEAKAIRHIGMNISYYLTDFLEKCPPEKIKVIMQESHDKDIKRHLNIDNVKRTNVTKKGRSKFLSNKALKKPSNVVESRL